MHSLALILLHNSMQTRSRSLPHAVVLNSQEYHTSIIYFLLPCSLSTSVFQWSAYELANSINTISFAESQSAIYNILSIYTIVIVTYWWLFENITFYNNRWIDLFYCLFVYNICVNYLKNLTLGLLFKCRFVVEEVDEEVFFLQGFFDFVEDIFALGFNRVEMIAGGCV